MSTIPRFKNNAPDIKSILTKISLKMSNQNYTKGWTRLFFYSLEMKYNNVLSFKTLTFSLSNNLCQNYFDSSRLSSSCKCILSYV